MYCGPGVPGSGLHHLRHYSVPNKFNRMQVFQVVYRSLIVI